MVDLKELESGVLRGDRTSLSKAITLLESFRSEDNDLGNRLLERLEGHGRIGFRLGITGAPGVGKSSFIGILGSKIVENNLKMAVLAIDPSSPESGGSILGDKTRMGSLAKHPGAFIRPSPTRGSQGGIAMKTHKIIRLFEASGYDIIIVETVGAGQSEYTLRSLVDYFLMLAIPGAGDELQGIKRGMMELVDGVVLTKADLFSDNLMKETIHEFKQILHFNKKTRTDPIVLSCSSVKDENVGEIWDKLYDFYSEQLKTEKIDLQREQQKMAYFDSLLELMFKRFIDERKDTDPFLQELTRNVSEGKMSPGSAAEEYFKKLEGENNG